ncbi:peptidoglycan-binding domain-containing protein [Pannus brasiliensis CCIBt3594]|uniref:Peptidoglycan-binding domain-containing protein n=2 Tax=Pannus TaxID=1427526 RepID=A0AAW9QYL3_9CHRO
MTRFHLGFSDGDAAYQLREQLWNLGSLGISRLVGPFRSPKTNEYLVSVEAESDEAIQLVANSDGRPLTNEEYEAYTAYSLGDRNDYIVPIQVNLVSKGYFQRRADGIFDLEMQQAVKAFQRDEGLEATGILDEETMNRLRDDKLFGI